MGRKEYEAERRSDGVRITAKQMRRGVREGLVVEYIATTEVVAELRISARMLEKWHEAGKLRSAKYGGIRYWSRQDSSR